MTSSSISTSTFSTPSKGLPRSPGGLLSSPLYLDTDSISRTSSTQSNMTVGTFGRTSPFRHPGSETFKRRSTGADSNGSFGYYWSENAGLGASESDISLGGAASPTLGVSPSPSLINPNPLSTGLAKYNAGGGSRSHTDLQEDLTDPIETMDNRTPRPSIPHQQSSNQSQSSAYSDSTPESSSASDASLPNAIALQLPTHHPMNTALDSPHSAVSAISADSQYSSYSQRGGAIMEIGRGREHDVYQALLHGQGGGEDQIRRGGSKEPRRGERERTSVQRDGRDSIASTSTARIGTPDNERTPIASLHGHGQRAELQAPPVMVFESPRRNTEPSPIPSSSSSSRSKTTPSPGRNSVDSASPGIDHSHSRLQRSPAKSRGTDTPPRVDRTERQQSLPEGNDFGGGAIHGDQDDTIKARNKGRGGSPRKAEKSPEKAAIPPNIANARADSYHGEMLTPQRPEAVRRGSSPGKSPDLPPRSALRQPPSPANTPSQLHVSTVPTHIIDVPTIVNTPDSPQPPPTASRAPPITTTISSPSGITRDSKLDSATSNASLSELTAMLGGAIDEIGLIDSRETPPPTVLPPSRNDKPVTPITSTTIKPNPGSSDHSPPLSLAPPVEVSLDYTRPPSALEDTTNLPRTTSFQSIQDIPTPHSGITNPASSSRLLRPEILHKANSNVSLRSTNVNVPSYFNKQAQPTGPTAVGPYAMAWPSAMMYGNIKSMKTPGERAKGYARAINELAQAESGLTYWSRAATSTNRAPSRAPQKTKLGGISSLGIRAEASHPSSSTTTLINISAPQIRNVSASSEFPMREDSYSAREISQRVIDPADQPTSLPPNLPYPQLQNTRVHSNLPPVQGGGIRPSPSIQSMASTASSATATKKGFFSAIRKGHGGNKKENLSLGPPSNPTNLEAPPTITRGKKDIRGLPISTPSPSDTQFPNQGIRAGSIPAPLGPRGQRGSYTPPITHTHFIGGEPRGSLDAGISRGSGAITPIGGGGNGVSRGSFESFRTARSAIPLSSAGGSPLVGGNTTPKEEDVRSMGDVLPHVEKGVLRSYLHRYGDQMQAIGAYIEDEKRGQVLRV